MTSITEFACLLVMAAIVCAQTPGDVVELRRVGVVNERDGVAIEMAVSSRVYAKLVKSNTTDELVVELPGVTPNSGLQSISSNRREVKSVRVEVHAVRPPTTWVVITLQQAWPHALTVNGNHITLHVMPVARAAQSEPQRRAPVAAAKAPILGGPGRPQADTTLPGSSTTPSVEPTPPPAGSLILFPLTSSEPPAVSTSTGSFDPSRGSPTPTRDAAVEGGAFPTATRGADSRQTSEIKSASEMGLSLQTEAAASERNVPAASVAQISQPNSDIRVAFKVKYVIQGVAYLEGGRSDGLAEGLKLYVKETDPTTGRPIDSGDGEQRSVAELQVFAVAQTSAATEIHDPTRDVKPGDWAYLSPEETAAVVTQRSLSATRAYPIVVSFTENDLLDDEARAEVPRPPLPEVNRARGRIGLDYTGVTSPSGSSNSFGLVVRTDITRINGTYWNLSGYWRGRINSRSSSGLATLQDLMNRTYHLSMTYDNPQSHWVAGFGRLYLPWASSLETIDGGYFGRRVSGGVIAGIFAGSTPDPTSWSYNPNRRLAGAFVSFEGGSFDDLRYTSTSGMGISSLKWTIDRPFVFLENGVSYKRYLSIYHSLQADSPRGNPAVPAPGAGISRSFLTVRLQPSERVDFDFNHTFFRDIPTFDPQLIGTGLLDKYLFQGFSAGVRVEVVKKIWAYSNLGRSNRSGDAKPSLNQMYGITFGQLPWVGVRADFRYSKFGSSFGDGSYKALSLSRGFREDFRWEFLAGSQSFASPVSKTMSAHFLTGNFEANLGSRYFLQSGYTINRGGLQSYSQWFFTIGYRFDSRSKSK